MRDLKSCAAIVSAARGERSYVTAYWPERSRQRPGRQWNKSGGLHALREEKQNGEWMPLLH